VKNGGLEQRTGLEAKYESESEIRFFDLEKVGIEQDI